MKTKFHTRQERAVALIIVLAMLVLLSGLVVSFMTSVGNERAASVVANNQVTSRQIADSTVNLVISQIREATSQSGADTSTPTTWASQPGAIRTLSGSVGSAKTVSNGAGGVRQFTYQPGGNDNIFKLYSASRMKIPTSEISGKAWEQKEVDVIENWDRTLSDSAREETKNMFGYVDLNEPIVTPMPASLTGGDARVVEPRYPIIDPRAKYSITETPNTSANPGIVDGFDMKTTNLQDPVLKFVAKNELGKRIAGQTQKVPYLPMPVKWLYVMRDGSMAAADDTNGGRIDGATEDNPIIGRTAFWTDDDSCRLNINTASEGTFWDTPSISAEQESGNVDGGKSLSPPATAYSLALGAAQPVRGEYQRYPGHPATTSLSPALGWMWKILPTDAPRSTRDATLITMKDAIAQLAPFSPFGRKGITYSPAPNPPFPPFKQSTSMGGSYNADADVIDPKVDPQLVIATKRLYATVDEMVFRADRVTTNPTQATSLSSPNITPESLEKVRFFLTANSRSPELNLFGRPRVTFWPINVKEDQRTSYDDLFAFTSTLYKDPTGNRALDNTFYFTRYDAKSRTNDFANTLVGNKNPKLFDYLKLMTGDGGFSKIPSFGGSFASKYTATERDQILTEIFDYCRTINLVDTSKRSRAGDFNPYTPFYGGNKSGVYGGQAERSTDWSGQVTPLRTSDVDSKNGYQGLGRFPTVSEVAIVFGRSSLNPESAKVAAAPGYQATLILEMATVMPGFPAIRQTCWTRVTVDRPTFVTLPGNSVPLDIQLVGGPGESRINIINVASHDATNGRGFMPTLGFLNQMCYFPEPSGPTDITNPSAPKPVAAFAAAKKWQWVDGPTTLADVTKTYKRGVTSTLYPYCSKLFTLPAGTTELKFTGGAYTIEIFAGEAPDDTRNAQTPVQTIHVAFPSTLVTSPVPTTVDASFGSRITAELDNNWNIIRADDVVRSVEFVGPGTTLNQQGDLRLGQARREIPKEWFKERLPGSSAGQYGSAAPADNRLHGLTAGHGDPYSGFRPTSDSLGRGKLALNGTNRASKPAILPANVTGVQNASGGMGDFDRGLSKHMDGAFGNKVDEGNVAFEYSNSSTTGNKVPYWLGRGIEETGHSFFSPNRQISSAVMFGSLPTGAVRGLPWQTLLFRPDRGAKPHPGAQTSAAPADHLLLDLFNLPVVEPYAISESFSSAGKVNLNYVIAPFGYAKGDAGKRTGNNMDRSYLRRDTALRGVLKAVKIMAIPTTIAEAGHEEAPADGAKNGQYRFDIDAEKTLDQFENRLKDPTRGLFRSASEICDMDLYPQGLNVTDWASFWETQYAQTGDNQRERPYAHIYPRVTTKSNIYTIYMRCQAVKKVAGTPVDKFDPKRDKVISSYRGSATIERFVDPNDPELAKFDATSANSSVDKYYRFRVLATKQFLPR